jgi:hypothetical protein
MRCEILIAKAKNLKDALLCQLQLKEKIKVLRSKGKGENAICKETKF